MLILTVYIYAIYVLWRWQMNRTSPNYEFVYVGANLFDCKR